MTQVDANTGIGRRVTIVDVAKACGLSKATVSKALNLPPENSPVLPETRQKVLDAAQQLGYRPSWRARALAQRRTQTIALLFSQGRRIPTVYGDSVGVLNDVLESKGYALLLTSLHRGEERLREMLLDQRVDGCVVISHLDEPARTLVQQSGLPVVLLNAVAEGGFSQVIVDDCDGAVQLTRHLLSQGHRRIAFFTGVPQTHHHSVGQRQSGYATAMREAGLGDCLQIVESSLPEFVDMLKNEAGRPTAVITYRHTQAVHLLQHLWRLGISVPSQISVATFNDLYPAEAVIPPLTTMSLPMEEMGRLAGELLLERLASPSAEPRSITLKQTLVVRESTGPARQ